MVILTQYHTEIQNRGISTIGASEIFPVSRMPRFQRLHCIWKWIIAIRREQGLVEVKQAKFLAGDKPSKRTKNPLMRRD